MMNTVDMHHKPKIVSVVWLIAAVVNTRMAQPVFNTCRRSHRISNIIAWNEAELDKGMIEHEEVTTADYKHFRRHLMHINITIVQVL